MSHDEIAPCREWAPLLAATANDLAPERRAALAAHLAGCAACATAQAAYQCMDRQVRDLPAPSPLPDLPPRLARLWAEAAATHAASGAPMGASLNGIHAAAARQHPTAIPSLNHHRQGQHHTNEGMRILSTSHPSPQSSTAVRSRRSRRAAGWVSASIAVALIALFALVLLAQPHTNTGPGGHRARTSTNAILGTALPSGAPRAAYLGTDGHVHYVTLDGAHDTAGAALAQAAAWLTQPDNGQHDIAAAPDGSAFAYVQASAPNGDNAALTIVTLASGASVSVSVSASVPAANLWWSPNSRQIAADGYDGNAMGPVWIVDAQSGHARQIAATLAGQRTDVFRIAGWLDATHLAVLANAQPTTAMIPARSGGRFLAAPASGGPRIALDVLDLANGSLRHLVDLTTPPDVFVAPDGKAIFVAPSTWVGIGYVVDPATGATRDLPHISDTFSSLFVNIGNADFAEGGNWANAMAWVPGTHIAAMSLAAWGEGIEGTRGPATQPAGVWLLDLDHDSVTALTKESYPLAYPSSQTVAGEPLLVSSLPPSSVTFAARSTGLVLSLLNPGGSRLVLTRSMAVFIGLVYGT